MFTFKRLIGGRVRIAIAAGMILLAMTAVACDDDGDSPGTDADTGDVDAGNGVETPSGQIPEEGASSELCSSLDELQDSLGALGELNTESSIADLRGALTAIADDAQTVAEEAGDAANERSDELGDATDDFRAEVEALDEDSSINDAADAVEEGLSGLVAEASNLFAEADCGAPAEESPAPNG